MPSSVRIDAPYVADGRLRIVHVCGHECVTSYGEVLWMRSEKLVALAEQICQDSCAVTVRTWLTKHGVGMVTELIDLQRIEPCITPANTTPTKTATDGSSCPAASAETTWF